MTAPDTIRKTEPSPGWASGQTHYFAVFFWLLSLALFRQPLNELASLSLNDERSSHILLIPFISACFIYMQRKEVFQPARYCRSIGIALLLLAVVTWFVLKAHLASLNNTDRLAVVASLIVLVWIAAFIFFYGISSFKAAVFPLLFLLLMIPFPVVLADQIRSTLQRGSAEICYALFRMIGVPVIRHGFQFSLPGVDIEVAEQCSGIHSGLSLFIAGLLAAQVILPTTWRKVCFVLCLLPIAIFKNAVRIVTISWLGIHVNPDFFHGSLHHQGGLPFSFLALALMVPLLWLLRRPLGFSTRRPLARAGV